MMIVNIRIISRLGEKIHIGFKSSHIQNRHNVSKKAKRTKPSAFISRNMRFIYYKIFALKKSEVLNL